MDINNNNKGTRTNQRLERAMRKEGQERQQRNRSKQTLDQTKSGLEVIAFNIDGVEDKLKEMLRMRRDAGGGAKQFWELWLKRADTNWTSDMTDRHGEPVFNEIDDMNLFNVADIALRTALEGYTRRWTLADLVMSSGTSFYNHCYFRSLVHNREGRKFVDNLNNITKIDTSDGERRRHKVARIARHNGFYTEEWTDGNLAKCGVILWNAAALGSGDPDDPEDFGIFATDSIKEENDKWKTKYVDVSPKYKRLIDERNKELDDLAPLYGPMQDRPFDWGMDHAGPYRSQELALGVKLVRNASREHTQEIDDMLATGEFDYPVRAINHLQAVPFVIDKYVLKAVKWVKAKHSRSREVNDFPSLVNVENPKLSDEERAKLKKRERTDYNKERRERNAENREVRGNRLQVRRWIKQGERYSGQDIEFGDIEKFYMPHNFDRRGRVYHVAEFGHHNTDCLRAMFQFAIKKPVGNNIGLLALTLANHKGHDKITLDQRTEWAAMCEEVCIAAGKDFKNIKDTYDYYEPVTHDDGSVTIELAGQCTPYDFWRTADAPFQFLAACHELANFRDFEQKFGDGSQFLSGLPIPLDAAQSGIQHYALASRNYDDGFLTNIVPQDKPNDLYKACLNKAKALLQIRLDNDKARLAADPLSEDDKAVIEDHEAFCDDETTSFEAEKAARKRFNRTKVGRKRKLANNINAAERALAYEGYNRSFIKRNAMTFAYSSRQYGFADQIRTDHMKPLTRQVRLGEIAEHPFGKDNGFAASVLLAEIHEAAIREVVSSVSDGMDFFQSCADALHLWNRHFGFKTKWGFPMRQYYEEDGPTYQPETYLANHQTGQIEKGKKTVKIGRSNGMVHRKRSRNAISPNVIHAQDSLMLQMCVLKCAEEDVRELMVVHDSFATCIADGLKMSRMIREATVDLYEEYDLFKTIEDQLIENLRLWSDNIDNVTLVERIIRRIHWLNDKLSRNPDDLEASNELDFIGTTLTVAEYGLTVEDLLNLENLEDAPAVSWTLVETLTRYLIKTRPDREDGKLDIKQVLASDYYVC